MKIEPPRGPSATTGSRRATGASGAGFSLPSGEARATPAASAATPLTALDAVLALQVDGGGKRRRQLRRGAASLDALDRLAASLLDGGDGAGGDVATLAAALKDREPTGDAGLDSVLREIDVRTAVELAKREMRTTIR
ncbi:MAG: flagellar assembly protein FliX [Hyphomonadaceae bacterium]|nr:MAG: flagellar assembly regulator FliX class II [Caulobacteraceae bacterium]MBT9445773.1 flagellar assembly protein FliX [Hyphomonadaceae bacterium]TPW06611.1 MAG: flagellar assembly regulator FliX, class II [Alphaproteobacteria bacterium]